MDRDAILQKVIEVVNDTLDIADGTELTEQTSFKDLGADSFDLLELVTALEDELDMQFDDDHRPGRRRHRRRALSQGTRP